MNTRFQLRFILARLGMALIDPSQQIQLTPLLLQRQARITNMRNQILDLGFTGVYVSTLE